MRLAALALLWLSSCALAQTRPQSTSVTGKCNGTATGSGITVTVQCQEGMSAVQTKALAAQYSAILNQIKHENLKFDDVIQRLRNIQEGVDSVKSSVKARHLTTEQASKLTALPHENVFDKTILTIETSLFDAESITYAEEIAGALGVQVDDLVTFKTPQRGVELIVSKADVDTNKIPGTCTAIYKTFQEQIPSFIPIQNNAMTSGHCKIVVGYKTDK